MQALFSIHRTSTVVKANGSCLKGNGKSEWFNFFYMFVLH